MPELQLLSPEHSAAILAFELANRDFFARTISDRGDAYFENFTAMLAEVLADQGAGVGAFYVLVDGESTVLGRFNLTFGPDGTAELGFRVAEEWCGRGVATATVRELCGLAAARHDLRTVRAAAAHTNPASRRVLAKTGFVPDGPADPAHLGGKPGTWFRRDLAGG